MGEELGRLGCDGGGGRRGLGNSGSGEGREVNRIGGRNLGVGAVEVLIASSPIDAGIGCWDLQTGTEKLRYRGCASPQHGLCCIAQRFLASSQLHEPSSSYGSVLYWSWNKPQAEVKSFPAEPIRPLVSNHHGTYIIGGGVSGHIYLWEVATGRLLQRWHGHYRAVTCLVLSDDESLLISGAEDGFVRVWSFFMIFNDQRREEAKALYEYSFSQHTLRVTDVVSGYGGGNAIIISASEDRTCKVWSLSKGDSIRTILFPSIINSVALDPGEHVFYAGGKDGRIYIAALNAQVSSNSKYGMHIIGSLFDHSKAVTCLVFGADGFSLVSGSEDGVVRVWDTRTHNIFRIFKHSKGPVNNIIIVERPLGSDSHASQTTFGRRHGSTLAPPLAKYATLDDEDSQSNAVITGDEACKKPLDASYITPHVMESQIRELQQVGSDAAMKMENERVKHELQRSMQMVEQWKKMYDGLHEFCVDELLSVDQTAPTDDRSP